MLNKIAGALCILLCARCLVVSAAEPTAASSITVHIVDGSGKPIWLAQATIYGPRILIAASTRTGDAVFAALPAGLYRLHIARYGYQAVDVAGINVGVNADLTVTASLPASTIKQIANVTVRARPHVASQQVDLNNASAEISNSLVTALHSLPGVSMNAANQASINGYTPGQTTVTINGVPVSMPGVAQNLQLFNTDIFSSASVMPQAGGGGTVNFQTQTPTLAWQGVARAVLSSDNGEDIALQEAGTVGDIGVSFTHAWNMLSNPLEGASFFDTSGLFYAHRAADTVNADALQLRYEFSPSNTLLASAVGIDATLPIICTEWTGEIPCGYGPTNLQQSALQTYQIKDVVAIGRTTLSLTLYDNASSDDVNQTGYYVNGVHLPSSSVGSSRQNGASGSAQIAIGHFLLPLNFAISSTVANAAGSAFGPLLPTFVSRYSSQSISTALPLISRPRLNMAANIGFQSNSAEGSEVSRANASLVLGYVFSNQDSLNASFSPGNLGAPTAAFTGISPPNLLQFICSENVGIGNGPSTASVASTQMQSTLSWTHNAARWSSQVNAYYDLQLNAPVLATVNALSLAPSLFGPNYLTETQQNAQSACGNNRIPDLSDLYYHIAGIASKAVYEGGAVTVTYDLNDNANIAANYSTTVARAYGSDPTLFGPRSTVISGEQLPNVPIHTANVVFKQLLGTNTVGLLQVSYSSANNSFNLPAYADVDMGTLITLRRGLLSISLTNLGNLRPGPFATTNGAVPLRMLDGDFPTVAYPLMPRTLNVGYRFHIGLPEQQVSFSIPNEQFQPLPTLGLRIQIPGVVPFSSEPPADPFAVDRQRTLCGIKDVPLADAVLGAWRSYVQGIEKARIDAAYPAAYPAMQFGALQFNYLKYDASYVVFVTAAPEETLADFTKQFQPVEDCALIQGGSQSELLLRHLYDYPATSTGEFALIPLYAPEGGLYHETYKFNTPQSGLPEPENLRYAGSPPSAPADRAFTVKDWPGCSPELRPAAIEFLQAVRQYVHAYFDLREAPSSPQGLLIAPHANGEKSWISIRTEDLDSLSLLRQCLYFTPATHATLQKFGFSGDPLPALNYAPLLGFYDSR